MLLELIEERGVGGSTALQATDQPLDRILMRTVLRIEFTADLGHLRDFRFAEAELQAVRGGEDEADGVLLLKHPHHSSALLGLELRRDGKKGQDEYRAEETFHRRQLLTEVTGGTEVDGSRMGSIDLLFPEMPGCRRPLGAPYSRRGLGTRSLAGAPSSSSSASGSTSSSPGLTKVSLSIRYCIS